MVCTIKLLKQESDHDGRFFGMESQEIDQLIRGFLMYNHSMKKRILWIVLGVVVLILGVLLAAFLGARIVQKEETIDCMPPLSEHQQKACAEAEERGYPNITY